MMMLVAKELKCGTILNIYCIAGLTSLLHISFYWWLLSPFSWDRGMSRLAIRFMLST